MIGVFVFCLPDLDFARSLKAVFVFGLALSLGSTTRFGVFSWQRAKGLDIVLTIEF